MAEFIELHHPELGVTVTLPATALASLDGWEPVDPAAAAPAGSVSDVLAEVGNDPVLAAAALAAEQSRPKPRTTLVDALTAITAPTQET